MLFFLALFLSRVFGQDENITIYDNVAATGDLSTLATVASSNSAVTDLLNDTSVSLTLFAPSNAAFTAAGVNASDADLVQAILQYHVLLSKVLSTDLSAGAQLVGTVLSGPPEYANLGGSDAQVVRVTSDNGVTLNWNIPGEADETATVTTANEAASNGVIHIIDKVLMPPPLTSATATTAGLTDLVAALGTAGLVDTVDETASLTIFAPNNAAFAALGDISNLTTSELAAVLKNHVVSGVAYSAGLSDGQVVATLEGEDLTIGVDSVTGAVTVTSEGGVVANVTVADALVTNGVVHVIDAVLLNTVTTTTTTTEEPTTSSTTEVTEEPMDSNTTTTTEEPTTSNSTEAPSDSDSAGRVGGALALTVAAVAVMLF